MISLASVCSVRGDAADFDAGREPAVEAVPAQRRRAPTQRALADRRGLTAAMITAGRCCRVACFFVAPKTCCQGNAGRLRKEAGDARARPLRLQRLDGACAQPARGGAQGADVELPAPPPSPQPMRRPVGSSLRRAARPGRPPAREIGVHGFGVHAREIGWLRSGANVNCWGPDPT